jgi:hypothetical protein
VWSFVGQSTADAELKESRVARGELRRSENDQCKRLSLAVIVEPVKEKRANRITKRGDVLNVPPFCNPEAREVVLADFGHKPGEDVGQNDLHVLAGAASAVGLRNLT